MASEVKVPKLFTVAQAAAATGLPRWRLYELLSRGEGPAHMRVGRTIRISEVALCQWIEQQHTNDRGRLGA